MLGIPNHLRSGRRGPDLAAGLVCLFMAVIFVTHISLVQIHLLTEKHTDDYHFATSEDADLGGAGIDRDHSEQGQHKPHPASEHHQQMVSKPDNSRRMMDCSCSNGFICIVRPAQSSICFFRYRVPIPFEPPPDPLQPRSPPLA